MIDDRSWVQLRSGRYQVVTTCRGHCPSKPSRHITNTKVNTAFHPSGVGKSSWLGLRRGAFTCVRWQVILCDLIRQVRLRSSMTGYHFNLLHTSQCVSQKHTASLAYRQ